MAKRKKSLRMLKRKPRAPLRRSRARFLEGIKEIDVKNFDLLRRFVTEHGRIIPGRLMGVTAKQQRQIRRAVHRARAMGLLA